MANKSKAAYDVRSRVADVPLDKSDIDRRRASALPAPSIDGVAVTGSMNLSSSTPAAPAGTAQVSFQKDVAGNVSGYVAPRFNFASMFLLMGA